MRPLRPLRPPAVAATLGLALWGGAKRLVPAFALIVAAVLGLGMGEAQPAFAVKGQF